MENGINTEIVSLVALIIAFTSTIINYLVLRSQRDPEVVVYALPDARRPTIINLIIENVGKGRARDIRFESSRPIPERAFGFDNAPVPGPMKDGPLVRGIPAFAPGEKRTITWGQFGGLRKGLGEDVLDITATYKGYPAMRFTPKSHKTTSRIDIKSFEGTDASDHNWDKKAAEQLEQIAKALSELTDVVATFKQTHEDEQNTHV
ncbi:MAG: hypothetical protein C0392_07660 [Syntrophus sp. (in: bacteria)]|nr:hypothetical protein [Syntrophus sp. (in: bacteria)]